MVKFFGSNKYCGSTAMMRIEYSIEFQKGKILKYSLCIAVLPRNFDSIFLYASIKLITGF